MDSEEKYLVNLLKFTENIVLKVFGSAALSITVIVFDRLIFLFFAGLIIVTLIPSAIRDAYKTDKDEWWFGKFLTKAMPWVWGIIALQCVLIGIDTSGMIPIPFVLPTLLKFDVTNSRNIGWAVLLTGGYGLGYAFIGIGAFFAHKRSYKYILVGILFFVYSHDLYTLHNLVVVVASDMHAFCEHVQLRRCLVCGISLVL